MPGYHVHPETLHGVSSRTRQRQQQISGTANGVQGAQLSGGALGMVGSSTESSHQQLLTRSSDSLHKVADKFGDHADRMSSTAQNYAEAEESNSARFSHQAVHGPATPKATPSEGPSATGGKKFPLFGGGKPPRGSHLDPHAPNVIEGKDSNGNTIHFTADEVNKFPFFNHNGQPNASMYVPDTEYAQDVGKWAKASNGHDSIHVMPHNYQDMNAASADGALVELPAPWAGHPSGPFYVPVHANGSGVGVELHDGTSVDVGGAHFGKLLHNDPIFQQQVGSDPTRPIVGIACNLHENTHGTGSAAGMANGSGAVSLKNSLVNYGYPNPLYTSSTTVQTNTTVSGATAYTTAVGGGQWFKQ